jgi:hypothetical protein
MRARAPRRRARRGRRVSPRARAAHAAAAASPARPARPLSRGRRLPQSENPYVLIPFTSEPGVRHQFALSVFASREVDFSKIVPQPCDLCPSGGECKSCPMVQIMRRLDALETRFDNHLSFLEKL